MVSDILFIMECSFLVKVLILDLFVCLLILIKIIVFLCVFLRVLSGLVKVVICVLLFCLIVIGLCKNRWVVILSWLRDIFIEFIRNGILLIIILIMVWFEC